MTILLYYFNININTNSYTISINCTPYLGITIILKNSTRRLLKYNKYETYI